MDGTSRPVHGRHQPSCPWTAPAVLSMDGTSRPVHDESEPTARL